MMPNLRAYNLFWGDLIDAVVAPTRDATFDTVARLLQATCPGRQTRLEARDAAEALIFYSWTWPPRPCIGACARQNAPRNSTVCWRS